MLDKLDMLMKLKEKEALLDYVFGDVQFLAEITEELTDDILDEYGIPPDGDYYCRDYWYDLLWGRLLRREVTKKEVVKELSEWPGFVVNDK